MFFGRKPVVAERHRRRRPGGRAYAPGAPGHRTAGETVAAVDQQLADLNAELETEVDHLQDRFDPEAGELEVLGLKPKKTDVEIRSLTLGLGAEAGRRAGLEVGREPEGLPAVYGSSGAPSALSLTKGGRGMVDTVLSILIGLGLAAACGFRVFVPLLVMSLASRAGVGHLALELQLRLDRLDAGAARLLGGDAPGDRRLLHPLGGQPAGHDRRRRRPWSPGSW